MDQIVQQLNIIEYIDVHTIMALMGIGFILKHYFAKVKNRHIPYCLLITSLIYYVGTTLISKDFTKIDVINAVIDGIITAAISIGLHTGGKEFLKSMIKYYPNIQEDSYEEETYDEEEYEDEDPPAEDEVE